LPSPPTPTDHRGRLTEAVRLLGAGRFAGALQVCDELLTARPGDAGALGLRGAALLRLGRAEEGRLETERALGAAPSDWRLLQQLALACTRLGRFAEAHGALDRALAARPGDPSLVGAKGELLCTEGRYDEALSLCSGAWRPESPHPMLAMSLSRAARQTGQTAIGIGALEQSIGAADRWPGARPDLLYALAEARDAVADYDGAFTACAQANRLVAPPHDPEAQSRGIDALIGAWTAARTSALARGPRTERPVFIVGFWRSGTTLVEQVLSCHPGVAGAGELLTLPAWVYPRRDRAASIAEPVLTDLDSLTSELMGSLSSEYLARLAETSATAARVTDKMPVNFMHLGLISACLPGARIIVCTRDPVDTCLSVWFNVRGNVGYAHDLYACGRFHRDAERLIAHWRGVVDSPVLEVRYEDFVNDPDGGARRLIDFVGLPWDEACLRPHASTRAAQTRSIDQVRRPVYRSSIGRAAAYGARLDPLRAGLEDGLKRGTRPITSVGPA
jgi:hypothetical protein